LAFIFCVGIFTIAVAVIRLTNVVSESAEGNRIKWSTVEILAATFVANMRVFYAFLRRIVLASLARHADQDAASDVVSLT